MTTTHKTRSDSSSAYSSLAHLRVLLMALFFCFAGSKLIAQGMAPMEENTFITRSEFRQLVLAPYRELESRLAYFGGAGDTLDLLITSDWLWDATYTASPVLHVDAKTAVAAFYDRLTELGYTGDLLGGSYPWEGAEGEATDYTPLTWGQALYLFNFSLDDLALDSDGDGLLDLWELDYFGHLGQDGTGDYDEDGVLNAVDSNPVRKDADEDGILDGDDGDPTNFYNGATLTWHVRHIGIPTAFAFTSTIPQLHYELQADGEAIAHAPIEVQALSPQGYIIGLNGEDVRGTVFTTHTDSEGYIRIGYQYGAPTLSVHQLVLRAVDTEVTASIALDPLDDLDGDGLPSVWENSYGLNAMDDGSIFLSNGPMGNPDSDAAENLVEYQNSTHPLVADTDVNIIYVDADEGSDNNNGFSLVSAKASITGGLESVADEGILVLFGGENNYQNSTLNYQGRDIRLRIQGEVKVGEKQENQSEGNE